MEDTKFRLNLQEVDNAEESDFEYLATQDKENPDLTLVTWCENGTWHKAEYETSIVGDYFHDGIWVEN